jgi:hypothetical protein
MHRSTGLALVISLLAVVVATANQASFGHVAVTNSREGHVVFRASDLRSAYLVRAGLVRYDSADMSADAVRRQLQRHFDAVLQLLVLSTPASIEVALNRLESAREEIWSPGTRAAWRNELLANRRTQVMRLAAYRDRGRFPLNEGQALYPVPIFVDRHDTACAVGHLMRLTGCESDVECIQNSNNLVYVRDTSTGPVAEWVLVSGLTLEEAALVQPAYPNYAYELPPIPYDAAKPLEAGWSGAFDDLRFSNFRFYRDGETAPSVNADVSHSFCSRYACSMLPRIEDYDGRILHTGWFEVLPEGFNDFERVVLQFDVETVFPTQRIARRPHASTMYTRPNQIVVGQRNEISLFAGYNEEDVFIHELAEWEPAPDAVSPPLRINGGGVPMNVELLIGTIALNDFQPVRSMTVVTELLLRDGQPYQAQRLYIDVVTVPEPAAMALLGSALVAIGGTRIRKKGARQRQTGRVRQMLNAEQLGGRQPI